MIAGSILDGLVQGAIAIALAAIVLRLVPAKDATTRYAVWFATLMVVAAAPISSLAARFVSHLALPSQVATSASGTFSLVALGPIGGEAARWIAWPFALGSAVNAAVAVVWLVGASIAFARLGASFAAIRRICRTATNVSEIDGVPVLASRDLRIPIATGLFRPAIVLPDGLADRLTPSELRCMLEHELAHVRRGDVATNAIQRVAEALFFWNPWVYVVGRQLVTEREAACDDVAAGRVGETTDYARALAALGRRLNATASPLLTPSAFGSHGGLVARIERLALGAPARSKLNYVAFGGSIVLFSTLAVAASLVTASAPASAGTAIATAPVVATASCAHPNSDVKALAPAPPELPKAQWPSHPVTALVRVDVAVNGKATAASVYRSSGNANVDRAVVTAAEKSTYAPKTVNCTPVASTYLFMAKFGP